MGITEHDQAKEDAGNGSRVLFTNCGAVRYETLDYDTVHELLNKQELSEFGYFTTDAISAVSIGIILHVTCVELLA
jgi:hypothetical protein